MNNYEGFKSQALDFNIYSDGVSVSSVTQEYTLAPALNGQPRMEIKEGTAVIWSTDWKTSPPPYTEYPTRTDDSTEITSAGKNFYWERQITTYSNNNKEYGTPSKSTMLDVDFINALGITAKKITVLKNNEAASDPNTNPIIFEADGYDPEGAVTIGGFIVDAESIASGKKADDTDSGVGIRLTSTDGQDGTAKVIEAGTNFSVDASGNIVSTGGKIGGWEISKDSLDVSGSTYTYDPTGALTTTTYTNTLAAAPTTVTLPTPEITIDDFGASTGEYTYVGEGEKKEKTVSYTIRTANWVFSNPVWAYDAASLTTKTWQLGVETPCTEVDISLILNETYSLGDPIHVELPKNNGEFDRQSFEDGYTLNYVFRDAPLADRQINGTCTVKFYGSTIETLITSLSLSNKSNPFEPPVDDPKLSVTIAITNCKNPATYSCTKEITYKLPNPTTWQDLDSIYVPEFNKTLPFDTTGSKWLQLTSSSDSTLDITPKLSANYFLQNNTNYCIKLKVDLGNDVPCKIPYAFAAYPTIDFVSVKRDDLACILALGKTSASNTATAPFRVDLDGTVHISRGGLELTGDGKAYSGGWGSSLKEKTLYITRANQAQFTTTKLDPGHWLQSPDYWDNWAQQGTTELFDLIACKSADQANNTDSSDYGDWRSSGFNCVAGGDTTHNGVNTIHTAFIQGLATSAYHARNMHAQLAVGEWNGRRISSSGSITDADTTPILWGSFITPFTISDSPDLLPTYSSDDKKYHIDNSKAASSRVGMCLVSGGTEKTGDDWPWAFWAGNESIWGTKAFRVGHDGTVLTADGVHTGSDRNIKNTISDLGTTYDNFFDNLRGVSYKVNHGTSNRLHIGFIAQEVESALIQSGLTTQDFAGMCIEHLSDEDRYNLRYNEFIALNTDQIQKLKTRVAELEATVEELTKLVNEKLNQA